MAPHRRVRKGDEVAVTEPVHGMPYEPFVRYRVLGQAGRNRKVIRVTPVEGGPEYAVPVQTLAILRG